MAAGWIAPAAQALGSVGGRPLQLDGGAAGGAAANLVGLLGSVAFAAALAAPISAGVYRAVLDPADKGFARLRLGPAEARLFGVWLAFAALVTCAFQSFPIAFGLRSQRGPWDDWTLLAAIGLWLLLLWAVFWLCVRLCLLAPLSFAEGRVRLGEAWRLTRGRFWGLAGCAALTMACMLLVFAVSDAVRAGPELASGASLGQSLIQPRTPASFRELWSLPAIARQAVDGVAASLSYAIGFAAFAAACRDLREGSPERQASVFD